MSEQSSETPVLDLLEFMTLRSLDASGLDPRTLMLVRLAALAAVDAPPVSYLMNISIADDLGVDEQSVRDVLAAIAPIVGTARTASAISKIARALGLALDIMELEDEESS